MQYPTVDIPKTGENIREMRRQRGLRVEDIREVMGFSYTNAVYKWEEGKGLPTVDNLVILAWMFDVRVDDILVKTC